MYTRMHINFKLSPAQKLLLFKLIGNLLDLTVDVYYVRLCYSRTARLLICWVHVGHHTSDLRDILPIRSLCVGCWRVCGRKMKDESQREHDRATEWLGRRTCLLARESSFNMTRGGGGGGMKILKLEA